MPSKSTRDAIKRALQAGENEEDVVEMIDLLAAERARVAGHPSGAAEELFASTILCVVFDPVKTKDYRASILSIRQHYGGIAKDPKLKELFLDSLTPEILSARTAGDALKHGADALFRIPTGWRHA